MVDAQVLIDHVVEIAVDDEEIVNRLSGRRVHPGSGRVYHLMFNKPQREGVDDVTGEPLVQREDDTEETVRKRLQVYSEQTRPLIDFYRKMKGETAPQYHKIIGAGSVDDIRNAIAVSLES
jgi:adenylate kinase